MSKESDGVGNIEYYLDINGVDKVVSVMKYVFDALTPNGSERKVVSIKYTKKSGYSCEEAKLLCEKLMMMLETTDWRGENNVY